MEIFNGKREAEKILSDLKKKISRLKTKPGLAVILVGKNPNSELYISLKRKAAKRVGIRFLEYRFKQEAQEKEVIQEIQSLNQDSSIYGILVQLPLPKSWVPDKIIRAIDSKKDVDGFGKRSSFASPLISAVLIALKASTKKLKNKKALAIVNSDLMGQALRRLLKKERITTEYLLQKKLSKSKVKETDIIITVCGHPSFIKGDMIKDRAILIDAGFTRLGKRRVMGDVDRESVKDKASFLTPVPGGIGPLTVALLLRNVYLSAKPGLTEE